MLVQALSKTLFKFALLLVIGGILMLGMEFRMPIKVSPDTSYRSETTVLTLHCNAQAFCELNIQQ